MLPIGTSCCQLPIFEFRCQLNPRRGALIITDDGYCTNRPLKFFASVPAGKVERCGVFVLCFTFDVPLPSCHCLNQRCTHIVELCKAMTVCMCGLYVYGHSSRPCIKTCNHSPVHCIHSPLHWNEYACAF